MLVSSIRSLLALATILAFGAGVGSAAAQCILTNPSFEIAGTGGPVFGGWNQFGDVGSVSAASHGHAAARAGSPDTGGWDLSGFWQTHDCAPGEVFAITGHVLNPSSRPLSGMSGALVNVEWRSATNVLLDYDSFTVAHAGSPHDEYLDFSLLSDPAPVGTAWAVLLLGNIQGPDDSASDAYFDQVTFFSTNEPTIDDVQWNDFPGDEAVEFGGRTWRIKGDGYYGPGPNLFSDAANCVWVDDDSALHLTLQKLGNAWYSTEVVLEEVLGYGDYIVTTRGSLDLLDPRAVLGMFLWEYGPCWDYSYTWWGAFNEFDIEYSRWLDPSREIGQFVAQPFDWPGNISHFDAAFGPDEVVSHAVRWLPDRVECRVWRGGPHDEAASPVVHAWTYNGPHIPRPEQPRFHLNLWRIEGEPDSDQEVVLTDFTFYPGESVSAVGGDSPGSLPGAPVGRLCPAAPNPFNPRTTVRFELDRDAIVTLAIHDAAGRRVRTLFHGTAPAGDHVRIWNGRDDAGQRLASGVYLVRLAGADFVETNRVVLLK